MLNSPTTQISLETSYTFSIIWLQPSAFSAIYFTDIFRISCIAQVKWAYSYDSTYPHNISSKHLKLVTVSSYFYFIYVFSYVVQHKPRPNINVYHCQVPRLYLYYYYYYLLSYLFLLLLHFIPFFCCQLGIVNLFVQLVVYRTFVIAK